MSLFLSREETDNIEGKCQSPNLRSVEKTCVPAILLKEYTHFWVILCLDYVCTHGGKKYLITVVYRLTFSTTFFFQQKKIQTVFEILK